MTDQATPAKVRPVAWAVVAFGRVQKLVVRADVADELACKWRERDPDADIMPLYGSADGEELGEDSPSGWGETEAEAVQDLNDNSDL